MNSLSFKINKLENFETVSVIIDNEDLLESIKVKELPFA